MVSMLDLIFVRDSNCKKVGIRDVKRNPSLTTCTSFRIASAHGTSGACTTSGKLTVLREFMKKFQADIYMMGHLHERLAWRRVQIGANYSCEKLQDHLALGVITGAFLKTYKENVCGYGEEKLYDPVALGAAKIIINPETGSMKAEI
jgi:hypothetical protein